MKLKLVYEGYNTISEDKDNGFQLTTPKGATKPTIKQLNTIVDAVNFQEGYAAVIREFQELFREGGVLEGWMRENTSTSEAMVVHQVLAKANIMQSLTPEFKTPGDRKKEILLALNQIDIQLSPENLHQDGERPAKEAKKIEAFLSKKRDQLIEELGYTPSDSELTHAWDTRVIG